MQKPTDKYLSDQLIKAQLLTPADSQRSLRAIQETDQSLHSYLVEQGILTEEQILQTLSMLLHWEIVALGPLKLDPATIAKVPVKLAWYYRFVPIKIEGRTVTLAVASPLDVKIQDEIRVYLGMEPKFVLAKEKEVLEAIKKYYGLASDTIDRIMTTRDSAHLPAPDAEPLEDIEKKTSEASISKLVNQIILEAYHKRATDIHIEPYRNKVRLRYRIDGVLVDANLPQEVKHFLLPILSRIKIMANLSIEEKRLPQDGSAIVKTKEQDLDLRVSTIPTPRGESMVIRILPSKVMLFSLERLGLEAANVRTFRELVKKPHGIIFVTGPTGSGKTTTLYACLNEINSAERKIITIEDPIEYEMEGVTQIQVNPKVNLSFAAGLRSVLRHDPDILMVGEVRDIETAEIAIRTALTGHLVFSSLHTNDAASGITRLIEMGLEPYLVASSVEAFVAQRLVRIICAHCKEESQSIHPEIRSEMVASLNLDRPDEVKVFRGKGCEHCNNTGYYGRTAIYEILVMTDEIRTAILEKPRADYIKGIAVRRGMLTLRQDGWKKVLVGLTTPSEVMNVTAKEEETSGAFKSPPIVTTGRTKDFIDETEAKRSESFLYKVLTHEALTAANEYESRIYPRIEEKVEIRYKILGIDIEDPNVLRADHKEYQSTTEDLSAGGVRFSAATGLAVGTILDLRVQFLKNERAIQCLAKICRVEEDSAKKRFNIMVYYLDISSVDRVRLSQFISSRIKK